MLTRTVQAFGGLVGDVEHWSHVQRARCVTPWMQSGTGLAAGGYSWEPTGRPLLSGVHYMMEFIGNKFKTKLIMRTIDGLIDDNIL